MRQASGSEKDGVVGASPKFLLKGKDSKTFRDEVLEESREHERVEDSP